LAGVFAPVVMGNLVEYSAGSPATGYEHGFAISGMLLIAGAIIGLIWVNPEKSLARLAQRNQIAGSAFATKAKEASAGESIR
jgi:hypothetical protein